MTECLFCKIVAGEIPAEIVFETDQAIAFRDIDPKAPTHILVIPRKHYDNITELTRADVALAGALLDVVTQVIQQEALIHGYRLVANTGPNAGQSVDHVHFHILGGRELTWPPG
ncbi:MAG: histidine triad nucleotide-binding protein [Actinobacteria bacterium]|nr:histidine triad nucleotide-binding protein [Actinomycetota bacterium]NBY15988.1 histidine triad nucleotide-binding protein [Actinomycetota bacterium]